MAAGQRPSSKSVRGSVAPTTWRGGAVTGGGYNKPVRKRCESGSGKGAGTQIAGRPYRAQSRAGPRRDARRQRRRGRPLQKASSEGSQGQSKAKPCVRGGFRFQGAAAASSTTHRSRSSRTGPGAGGGPGSGRGRGWLDGAPVACVPRPRGWPWPRAARWPAARTVGTRLSAAAQTTRRPRRSCPEVPLAHDRHQHRPVSRAGAHTK